jgi:N-acetylneuraminic acid mutarotase
MIPRSALASVALGLIVLLADAQRDGPLPSPPHLTFEQRLAAQAAIERVYHRHRLGTSRPFEMDVPLSVLNRKVRDALRQSVALQEYWNSPITGEALRRELDRIRTGTHFPERLEEIRSALNHDDTLLMETFVRGELADRLARRLLAFDHRVQGPARREAEHIQRGFVNRTIDPSSDHPRRTIVHGEADDAPSMGTLVESADAYTISVALPADPDGKRTRALYRVPKVMWEAWWTRVEGTFDEARLEPVTWLDEPGSDPGIRPSWTPQVADDLWGAGSAELVPEARSRHTAIWTGSEMILWGWPASGHTDNTGARYDPLIDEWKPVSQAGASPLRSDHVAVWSGSVMIVWGGNIDSTRTNTGGRYDPVSDTWLPTSPVGAPTIRYGPTAVWAGSSMVVWGGYQGGGIALNTGGRYDPFTDTWQPTTLMGAPSPRFDHTAIWTGSRMIVWGGYTNTGAVYDPFADKWTPTSTLNAPSARSNHSAVWTGTEMIIWGSFASGFNPGGGRYNPTTDTWLPTNPVGDPGNRYAHSAIWTGQEMIVWGGNDYSHPAPNLLLNSGGRYNLQSDSWAPMTLVSAPSPRRFHSTVWTGSRMIVWGGAEGADTGGRYDPVASAWTATKSVREAPSPRYDHTAVWTGAEMVVWGGHDSTGALASGGRYDALLDAWNPVSTAGAPPARTRHTAIWTGSEMIVWGGGDAGVTMTHSGGRYDPVTGTWSPTSQIGAPDGREAHTAVWTGSEMIVWGGYNFVQLQPPFWSIIRLSSGGRYSPATNTWNQTSNNLAPLARYGHTAVWSGSEMVIWGGNVTGDLVDSTGGRYDPAADLWTPTPQLKSPSARMAHTAIWTGSEMIVWGGVSDTEHLQTGGRLDPIAGTWNETVVTGAPQARAAHSATWTGSEMVVFGGVHCPFPQICEELDTGGRYDPESDAWSPTSLVNAAPGRFSHTAIWTGKAVMVCGGRYMFTGDVIAPVDDRAVHWYGSAVPVSNDIDGDGIPRPLDCNDEQGAVWDSPGEVGTVLFTSSTSLGWSPPAQPGGDSIAYDTLRSTESFDFFSDAICLEAADGSDTVASDPSNPPLGTIWFYLVRGVNGCPGARSQGSLGARSDGAPRSGRTCP